MSATEQAAEYSAAERQQLLALAHLSIRSALAKTHLSMPASTPHLEEKRGAFTTLHQFGELRGCIGYIEAVAPLYRTIQETARSAAFHDPRFSPVTVDDLGELRIEISVMSPLFPVEAAAVRPGIHGIVVSHHGRRGLLLPQVATEYGWGREEFLDQCCRKAGVEMDAWRHGALLQAFTAEVFGENSPGESLRSLGQ
jgi:AmmeMemoRadiSam system protein A